MSSEIQQLRQTVETLLRRVEVLESEKTNRFENLDKYAVVGADYFSWKTGTSNRTEYWRNYKRRKKNLMVKKDSERSLFAGI